MAASRSRLHRHRRSIRAALESGESVRSIALRYGVSRHTADEYIARHLPELATDAALRKLDYLRARDRARYQLYREHRDQQQVAS